MEVKPPEYKRGSGCPRVVRIRRRDELSHGATARGHNRCGNCRGLGHNISTCLLPRLKRPEENTTRRRPGRPWKRVREEVLTPSNGAGPSHITCTPQTGRTTLTQEEGQNMSGNQTPPSTIQSMVRRAPSTRGSRNKGRGRGGRTTTAVTVKLTLNRQTVPPQNPTDVGIFTNFVNSFDVMVDDI